MTGNGGSALLASYRVQGRLPRVRAFVGFAISAFVVVMVTIVLVTDPHSPPPVWVFAAVWFVLASFLMWHHLRTCYLLDLDERELRWRAPIQAGQAPLTDLRAIRPSRVHGAVAVFEFVDGRQAEVYAKRGFADFTAQVTAVAPHAAVTTSGYLRFLERLPVRSAFRSGRPDRV
jgi:hypothetical protein